NTRRQIGARSITTGIGDIFGLEDQVVNEALNVLSAEVPTKYPNVQQFRTRNHKHMNTTCAVWDISRSIKRLKIFRTRLRNSVAALTTIPVKVVVKGGGGRGYG